MSARETLKVVAFHMTLRDGKHDEYVAAHDSISAEWPDLEGALTQSGVARLRIVDMDPDLIAVADVTDVNAFSRLWETESHQKWAQVMQPLLVQNATGSPAVTDLDFAYTFEATKDGAEPK